MIRTCPQETLLAIPPLLSNSTETKFNLDYANFLLQLPHLKINKLGKQFSRDKFHSLSSVLFFLMKKKSIASAASDSINFHFGSCIACPSAYVYLTAHLIELPARLRRIIYSERTPSTISIYKYRRPEDVKSVRQSRRCRGKKIA